MSDRDLQIKAFNEKNPKPERNVCPHSSAEMRWQFQKNNSTHVVTQCLNCGAILKRHNKADFPQWESLSQVDEALREQFNAPTRSWYEKRKNLLDQLPPAIQQPQFNFSEFDDAYIEKHPEPINPSNCKHGITMLTLRTYDGGSSAVVKQCIDCGKHISAVAKTTVVNIHELPDFDVNADIKIKTELSEWHFRYAEARNAAMWDFIEERGRKIASGEVKVIDTTTFGTYYDSKEWVNTRSRIMKRDDYKCQVQRCTNPAACAHHITYDRLGCENDLDLISLCTRCHELVHETQDLRKYRLTSHEIRDLLRFDEP